MFVGYGKQFSWLLLSSIAVHATLLAALGDASPRRAEALRSEELWLETLSPPVPPSPAPEEPKVEPPKPATPNVSPAPKPRSSPRPVQAIAPIIEPQAEGLPLTAAGSDAQGTLEVAPAGPKLAAGSSAAEPPRPALPAQLSLWLAPQTLQRMVIVRSPSALLAALPGYRDILRGADIDPFDDLRALRVFMPGLSAEQLVLAGVHSAGEPAIVQAAQRIATSRELAPTWRGSSQLRATSWLDGSGYDRGLAVHADAFLIGARRELPRLLGEQSPAAQVRQLSKTNRGVMAALALHTVSQYLPLLAPCQLRSLRISISEVLRLQLTAEYENSEAAAHAPACLAGLGESASPLRLLRELIARATAAQGGTRSQLRTGVTSEEIARLLDELCWSLRRVARA